MKKYIKFVITMVCFTCHGLIVGQQLCATSVQEVFELAFPEINNGGWQALLKDNELFNCPAYTNNNWQPQRPDEDYKHFINDETIENH